MREEMSVDRGEIRVDDKIEISQVLYWQMNRINDMVAHGATGNQVYNAVNFFGVPLKPILDSNDGALDRMAEIDRKYVNMLEKPDVIMDRVYWAWAKELYEFFIEIMDSFGLLYEEETVERG